MPSRYNYGQKWKRCKVSITHHWERNRETLGEMVVGAQILGDEIALVPCESVHFCLERLIKQS